MERRIARSRIDDGGWEPSKNLENSSLVWRVGERNPELKPWNIYRLAGKGRREQRIHWAWFYVWNNQKLIRSTMVNSKVIHNFMTWTCVEDACPRRVTYDCISIPTIFVHVLTVYNLGCILVYFPCSFSIEWLLVIFSARVSLWVYFDVS